MCKWQDEETIANTPRAKRLRTFSSAKRVTVSVVIEDDRRSKNGYEAGLITKGRQRLHASPQQGVF
jgi:hypothetical protein